MLIFFLAVSFVKIKICFEVKKRWVYFLYPTEEKQIASRLEEQAKLQLDAATSRAEMEAREKDLSEKQTKKLIKEYQKQVRLLSVRDKNIEFILEGLV